MPDRLPCTCSATNRFCPGCRAYAQQHPYGQHWRMIQPHLTPLQQAILQALATAEWQTVATLEHTLQRGLPHVREALCDLLALGKVEKRRAQRGNEWRLCTIEREQHHGGTKPHVDGNSARPGNPDAARAL